MAYSPDHQASDAGPGAKGVPGERCAYAASCESLTFPFVTRDRRELTITLAAQPVFDLARSTLVGRRVRRIIRHRDGKPALCVLGRRTLEAVDLRRIDLQTLRHGLDLLRLGTDETGVLPAFWRTVATSRGRFALLYAGLRHEGSPGLLLVEVTGGPETAPAEALAEVIAHFGTERLGVILHVTRDAGPVSRLSGAHPQCLAIDFVGIDHASPRAWEEATALIRAAREAAPRLMLLNLRPEWGEAAAAAGATHAVFAPMEAVTI